MEHPTKHLRPELPINGSLTRCNKNGNLTGDMIGSILLGVKCGGAASDDLSHDLDRQQSPKMGEHSSTLNPNL